MDCHFDPKAEPSPAVRRLIVLLPHQVVDGHELAQRVEALASPGKLEVLFVDLHRSGNGETHTRVATLTSIIRGEWTTLQTRVENDQDWVRAVKSVWQAGDVIICDTDHRVPTPEGKRAELGFVLTRSLDVPVCMVAGLCPQESVRHTRFLVRMAYYLIPIAILAGFCVVQLEIERAAEGGMRSGLVLLTFVITIGLLWTWNRFMNRTG